MPTISTTVIERRVLESDANVRVFSGPSSRLVAPASQAGRGHIQRPTAPRRGNMPVAHVTPGYPATPERPQSAPASKHGRQLPDRRASSSRQIISGNQAKEYSHDV